MGSDDRASGALVPSPLPTLAGRDKPLNLYNASTSCSPHSSATCWLRPRQQASPGQERCGSSGALWCDGQPFDLPLKAVDGSGHTSAYDIIQTRGRRVRSSRRSSRRGQSLPDSYFLRRVVEHEKCRLASRCQSLTTPQSCSRRAMALVLQLGPKSQTG